MIIRELVTPNTDLVKQIVSLFVIQSLFLTLDLFADNWIYRCNKTDFNQHDITNLHQKFNWLNFKTRHNKIYFLAIKYLYLREQPLLKETIINEWINACPPNAGTWMALNYRCLSLQTYKIRYAHVTLYEPWKLWLEYKAKT